MNRGLVASRSVVGESTLAGGHGGPPHPGLLAIGWGEGIWSPQVGGYTKEMFDP